ncbi:MAG: tetratricopeptide repeat protein [Planctomycetota bacterium]|jgi:Tol biopolymer transport system component
MKARTQLTNNEYRKRTNMKLQSICSVVFVLMLIAASSAYAKQSAGVLFQSGLYQEQVKGDLDAAIKVYERIIVNFPKNRPVTAKALLHIGLCYEKMGKQEAQKAYQRLIQEYADQHEPVAQARGRLAAMERDNGKSHVTVRKVFGVWGSPSPDGRYLAFANWGYGDLAVHDLVTGENRDITDGVKDWNKRVCYAESTPVWSPDGRQIAYGWNSGHPTDKPQELRIASLDGSKPRVLYRNENKEVTHIDVHDWSRDGKFILADFQEKAIPSERTVSEIVLVSVADGSVRKLKSVELPAGRPPYVVSRSLSPDGSYVAYARSVKENDGLCDIFLLATDGSGEEIPLVEHPADDFAPAWAPDGKTIVFCSDRSANYDAWLVQVVDGKPVGYPQLVKRGTGTMLSLGFTREGSLHYAVLTQQPWHFGDIYAASIDPATGKLLGSPARAIQQFEGFNGLPAWSPDGKNLAYISRRPSQGSARRKSALVIHSMETGQERILYPEAQFLASQYLRWSPDGRSILCGRSLELIDVQTGDVTRLVQFDPAVSGRVDYAAWSPDGKVIYYIRTSPVVHDLRSLVAHNLETGKERDLWQKGVKLAGLGISPDGRQLVFAKGSKTLMVIAVEGGESRILHRLQGEGYFFQSSITWTADGRYVLFGKNKPRGLWRIPAEGGEPQKVLDGPKVVSTVIGRRERGTWAMDNFLPKSKTSK